MVSVPSGGRPRHAVTTWSTIANRALSQTSAEIWLNSDPGSGNERAVMGGRLRRCERMVHMRVNMTRCVDAVG